MKISYGTLFPVIVYLSPFFFIQRTQAFLFSDKNSNDNNQGVIYNENKLKSRSSSLEYSNYAESSNFLPEDYDWLSPPISKEDGEIIPLKVTFSAIIMNVEVHEVKEHLHLEMNFRVHWVDHRLANLTGDQEFLVLDPQVPVWYPDVFVNHLKSVLDPVLLSRPMSIRIYDDGSVRFSARMNLVVSCHMNFHFYPANILHCPIDVKSYAYPSNILVLDWHTSSSASVQDGVYVPNYDLQLENPTVFNTTSSFGVYSGIRLIIKLRNEMSFHLLQTYLPSTLLIILAWLTFLIPQSFGSLSRAGQVMLTTVALFASVMLQTPKVSYIKALDVWIVFCIFFVFIIMAHHAVTLKLRNIKVDKQTLEQPVELNKEGKKLFLKEDSTWAADPSVLGIAYKSNKRGESKPRESIEMNSMDMDSIPGSSKSGSVCINSSPVSSTKISTTSINIEKQNDLAKKLANDYRKLGNFIRVLLRAMTPIIFLLFAVIYWSWLLISVDFFQK